MGFWSRRGRPAAPGRGVALSAQVNRGPAEALRAYLVPRWASRNFALVTLARIFMSSARALGGVLVPIYVAMTGFSAIDLGALVVVVGLASAVMSSVTGIAADRFGRRPFMVAFPLLAAGAAVVFAFEHAAPILFAAAAAGSFGRGAGAGAGAVGPYLPAESAFVSESVPGANRNSAFGRLTFASSLGALVGGMLATLAPAGAHLHGGAATSAFRLAFLVTAAMALVAGLVALGLSEPGVVGRSSEVGKRRRLRLPRRSRPLLYRLWVTNSVNGLGIGMFGPFVTYWFFRRFDAGAGEIGMLFAVINVVSAASTLCAAPLARRFGLVRTVSVARLGSALLLVPMVAMPSFAAAGGIYLLRMAVQRVNLPLRQSYVVGMADPSERASVAALSSLPSQLAMATSPLLAGYLFEEVSLSLPFDLSAVLQAANGALFWVFFRHAPPAEELESS